MRLPLLLLSCALLTTGRLATAQTAAGVPVAKPIAIVQRATIYFDADGQVLPSGEGAHHREEITFRDSVSGTVRTFFPSGKIRRIIPYAHIPQGIQHGVETNWYENGQMQTREEYMAGQRHGELLAYYASGTLKRRETYVKGFRTTGELFGPDGQARPFAEAEVMATYPGGRIALAKDLYGKVRYPLSALQNQIQGTVLVSFTVAKDGTVQNAHVLKSSSGLLDDAALTAVRKLKPFQPGMQDGEPVETAFTFPVVFRLIDRAERPFTAQEAAHQAEQYQRQNQLERPTYGSPRMETIYIRP